MTTLPRRSFLRAAVAGLGAASVGPILWRQPARAATAPPGGVHLTYGADPARSMVVSWGTAGSVADAAVDISPDGADWQTITSDGGGPAPDVTSLYHHVAVGGLAPASTYHWRVRHAGADPVTGRFTTAPSEARPFRFASFGDMGVSAGAAEIVGRLVGAQPAPELCFVVGDLCYADLQGGTPVPLPYRPETWDAWLTQIAPSASAVPWMPTVGNHEMERGGSPDLGYDAYLARFRLPTIGGPGPVTYSFRYANVAFVALDGNDVSYEITRNNGYLGAAQDAWLDGTLGALRSDPTVDFIVVGFHNCMYCTNAVHGSDGGNRSRWEPIFDAHGVDLVVNGHNHSWERTHPVRGGEPVVEAPRDGTFDAKAGTTYLTAGGGGQAEYPTTTHPASYVTVEGGLRIPERAPWSSVRYMAHSFALVDVTPRDAAGTATMKITGLSRAGAVVDTVTLQRTTAATATAAA